MNSTKLFTELTNRLVSGEPYPEVGNIWSILSTESDSLVSSTKTRFFRVDSVGERTVKISDTRNFVCESRIHTIEDFLKHYKFQWKSRNYD